MWKSFIKSILFFGIYSVCTQVWAQKQEPTVLAMTETGAYSVIERADWRRYNDGRYVGLVRHEVRASIVPRVSGKTAGSLLYQGNFFVLEQTLRDMRHSAQAVDEVIPVSFEIRENGTIFIDDDKGFPALRGFPTFPAQSIMKGFKWQAPGNRAIDPFNVGTPTIIPFTAQYEYRGTEIYRDMQVHRLYATYASRYNNADPVANGFSKVQGGHKVDILIRVKDGLLLFMRDELDDTYTLGDGSTVQFKGFTLTFGEGSVPLDRVKVVDNLEKILRPERPDRVPDRIPDPADRTRPGRGTPPLADTPTKTPPLPDTPSIDVTPVPEGIRLTVKDIRFAADSADFLAEERPRLDLIAEALKRIPDRTFLVEGHTAAIGRPSGEMELSVERAKRMVDELVKRGINADRFIYKGWGGTKPVADNSVDSGRSANRRVEITILE